MRGLASLKCMEDYRREREREREMDCREVT